jgi:site-specific DNA-cytosine methylase
MDFVSVNGLGGGGELGLTQAGLRLAHRTGSLGLGAPVVEGNRPLLGWDWEANFTDKEEDWHRHNGVSVVYGNPPCSGFSTLTAKQHRGVDAKINKCIWEVINYACLLKPAPKIVAFESVQQAYTGGRDLMTALREKLSAATGHEYTIYHLLQSNASLGGCSVRKRYFFVASRIPFGVEYAQPRRVARTGDALRDLQGLDLTFEIQPYRRPATWWSVVRRAEDGVDGHFVQPKVQRGYVELLEAAAAYGVPWRRGENTTTVLRRLYHQFGVITPAWSGPKVDKLIAKDFDMGMNQPMMWDPDRQGYVITGRGPHHSVHWAERRMYTIRECARIQGFPDTWRIWPARNYTHINSVWGKGVPVDAARWLGTWIRASLEGTPGTMIGEPSGEHEFTFNITHAYKHTLEMERLWEHQDHVGAEHSKM